MKKKLAVFIAVIAAMQALTMPVSALDSSNEYTVPSADPNFVEQSLADFLDENPGYIGYTSPEREAPSLMGADDAYFEWKLENGKYYLYRYQLVNGTLTETKMINYWYLDPSNDKWYYLKPTTGEMATGWCKVNSYWYYFNAGGIMQVDWYQVGGEWYYLRTEYIVSVYGGPEGGAMTGEAFLPATVGSNTRTQSYYFDYDCAMQDWTYPLPTSLVSGIPSSNYEPYYVNSRFAEWRDLDGNGTNEDCHNGLDLRAKVPVNVVSATDGTVLVSELTSSMGNLIVVNTGIKAPDQQPLYVRYMHLSQRNVSKNSTVSAGTLIGKTGSTGNVSPHFHIDVNAKGITTSSVSGNIDSNMGQNPAAFFTTITWLNKNPYGLDYCGYRD